MQKQQKVTALRMVTVNETPRSKTQVEIYGEQYCLIANIESSHVEKLAREVDERMCTMAETNPDLGPMRIAVLTLLGLASDLKAVESTIDKQQQSLTARCSELEQDIEVLFSVA